MSPRPRRRASDWTIWTLLVLFLAMVILPALAMIRDAVTGSSGGILSAGFGVLAMLFGIVVAGGLCRQYFLGEPHAVIGDEGVAIGRKTIPWREIVDVRALRMFGIPYVGIFVGKSASRRYSVFERLDWVVFRDGKLKAELFEAQLGLSVELAVQRAEEARLRSDRADIG